jgi:hypothetical protein
MASVFDVAHYILTKQESMTAMNLLAQAILLQKKF